MSKFIYTIRGQLKKFFESHSGFLNLRKISIRTFLGIADIFEGKFFKDLSEWIFKEVEWAIIITAVISIGIHKNIIPIIIFGILLLSFFFVYSISTINDKLFSSFKEDVKRVNERNSKHGLPAYSGVSTSFAFLIIMLILNLFMFLAIYYGIVAFETTFGDPSALGVGEKRDL